MSKPFSCAQGNKDYCLLMEMIPSVDDWDVPQLLEKSPRITDEILEDISDGCRKECLRKKIAARTYTQRNIEQMRCIMDYRYILGVNERREVGTEEAIQRWVKEGFAKVFSKLYEQKIDYSETIRHWDLYVGVEKLGCR